MRCFTNSSRVVDVDIRNGPPVQYPTAPEPIANAHYIPMRLTMKQRKSQRLMRGIILASNYTDRVDIPSKMREHNISREVTNALKGFLTSLNLQYGTEILNNGEFCKFKDEIKDPIEYMRRYKIMNPDLLRTDYVNFLYLLQDSISDNMKEVLNFTSTKPILNVKQYCQEHGFADILDDTELLYCITPVPKIEDRGKLNLALRYKDKLVDSLSKSYGDRYRVPSHIVEAAIRSLNDANNFINNNSDSAERLINVFKKYFDPRKSTKETCLAINEGQNGSRLTHGHEQQYRFVLQSLSLWKNISKNMFSLWVIAENDLLDSNTPYEMRETGQGLHRVQVAPNLYKAIKEILEETKKELGQWVGLERIHLGDNQVPNAFHFIDKYGQISRILVPILRVLERIETTAAEDKDVKAYIEEVWGSTANAQIAICTDFFRHGFDGSGGDNMDDAGSCIDGRLTSAWNWCNSIREKPFYPLFLLGGFTSFDGDLTL
eukprot:Tbor_TRINITY_DN2170_c0_g1::TRINITY_DN2170_c0_g1_i1::g.5428::m.5428